MYRANYPEAPGMHNRSPSTSRIKSKSVTFMEELKRSLVAIFFGVILLIVSSSLLFWNEGRAVQTAKSLDEGLQALRVLPNSDVAFEENNNKLVHVTGYLHTAQELSDAEYGIMINAVKLKRTVQMLQWVEHESTREIDEGDHTRMESTYSYNTEWRSDLVNSNLFSNPVAYQNPTAFPMEGRIVVADPVRVGTFILTSGLLDKIVNFSPFSGSERPTNPNIKLHAGKYYHSQDVWNPQVGDIRVEFSYAGLSGQHPEVVSIIGKQVGRELRPYQTEAGGEILLLYLGEKTAEEIFSLEHAQNKLLTWAVRGGGWLLMFVSFSCMTNICSLLVSRFPLVRDLVNLGLTSLNVSLSITLSLTIVALGWVIYRPMLGLGLLSLAALPFILSWIRLYRRDHKENRYRKI